MAINTTLVLVSCIVSGIFAVLGFISSIACIAYVIGLRNSTHQISYVPLKGGSSKDPEPESIAEEFNEELDNF